MKTCYSLNVQHKKTLTYVDGEVRAWNLKKSTMNVVVVKSTAMTVAWYGIKMNTIKECDNMNIVLV